MSSCGGRVGMGTVALGVDPVSIVGSDESRQALTIKAAVDNLTAVYLTISQQTVAKSGAYKLSPGEGYTFGAGSDTARGGRVAMWAFSPDGPGSVSYITEAG